jgi:16S rRNA (guanine(966)-N(2))-methyltransferase RsmD
MAKIEAARQRQSGAAATRKPRAAGVGAPDHALRIVGGLWKRTRLPVARMPGLRPTPDRVRETVFNWLGQDLSGWTCCDAFAGTGALGFEAASRGASAVTLIEQDRALVLQLAATKERLGADMVQIQRGDGVAALSRLPPGSQDVVFLDPPFDADLFGPALRAASGAVRPGAFVYLEAPAAWSDAMVDAWGLTVVRHLKAGAVHAHLLRKCDPVPHA